MNRQKRNNLIFWGATILLSLAMLGGGIVDIIQSPEFIEGSSKLGYPLYFFTLLGIFKIGGVLILLLHKLLPKQLVSLAYAGFFFDLLFAVLSHLMIGDYVGMLPPIPFFILLFLSRKFLNIKNR